LGIVRMGPPEELVLLLKRHLNVSTFVETGTFKGETAAWASHHFKKVITIENSKIYFDEAKTTHKDLHNVEFLFGDSRSVIKDILGQILEPAIFWLDAHWCGLDSEGSNDQCPIIEEIKLIGSTGIKHCIFIDDARFFLSPPPLPNRIELWPTIDQLCTAIRSISKSYYIVVFEDVIIGTHERTRPLVSEYCQEINTRSLQQHGTAVAFGANGLDIIRQGVRMVARGAWRRVTRAARF